MSPKEVLDLPLNVRKDPEARRPVVGQCIKPRWRCWRQLSSKAGRWAKEGVRLPWRQVPMPRKLPQKDLCSEEQHHIDVAVEDMLQAGAVYENTAKNLVLSPIYTVPKKEKGKRRLVINLRWVNSHLRTEHFKMTTMKEIKGMIRKDAFMAKIDLKDCYWQVPVYQKDQRFLSFRWKGKNYTFRSLPFGLSVSP